MSQEQENQVPNEKENEEVKQEEKKDEDEERKKKRIALEKELGIEPSDSEEEIKEKLLAKRAAILFVHGLDKRIDETMLYKIFDNYNVNYIKLAKQEKTGESLGYAFVGFGNRQKAGEALEQVNYIRVMNKTVRLAWYDRTKKTPRKNPENNVFVKNLPLTVGSKEFYDYFVQYGKILAAKVAEDEDGEPLGYGYVLYEKTECAKKAIEENHGKLWKDSKNKLYVCQLESKRPRKPPRYNNLYVRNIPKDWDLDQLKKYFSQYGEISSAILRTPNAERVHKDTPSTISDNILQHNYGFVCFKSIDGPAQKATAKVPYLKIKDEEYNKKVEAWAQIFRELEIKEENVYKCTCYVHEKKLMRKMDTNEGLREIKKDFEKLMEENEDFYSVNDTEDRLYCCQALKKKEREKRLRVIVAKLKKKIKAKYKYCNLYVKHLPDDFDKEDLIRLFSVYGPIRSAQIITQKKDDPRYQFIKRKTRVYAFVCYFTPAEAKKAKNSLHGKIYLKNGPRLYVDYHQTKKERLEFLKLQMIKRVEYAYPYIRPTPGIVPLTAIGLPYDLSEPVPPKQNIIVLKDQNQRPIIRATPPGGEMVYPTNAKYKFLPLPMGQNIPFMQLNPNTPIVPSAMPNVPMIRLDPNIANIQMNQTIPPMNIQRSMPVPMTMPLPVMQQINNNNVPVLSTTNSDLVKEQVVVDKEYKYIVDSITLALQDLQKNKEKEENKESNDTANNNVSNNVSNNINNDVNDENNDINTNEVNTNEINEDYNNINMNSLQISQEPDINYHIAGHIFKEKEEDIKENEVLKKQVYALLKQRQEFSEYTDIFPEFIQIINIFKNKDLKVLLSSEELFVYHMSILLSLTKKALLSKGQKKKDENKKLGTGHYDVSGLNIYNKIDVDFQDKNIEWKKIIEDIFNIRKLSEGD